MAAVSVLIPVYNTEAYLRRCLDSVTGQTLRDLEIICVDDGSTDGSAEILKEYRENDSRIRVITKPNGGLPSARNAGLCAAGGRYVGFVDSDDYIEADMFRILYEEAERKGSEVVVCGAVPESAQDGEAAECPEWLTRALSPRKGYYKRWKASLVFGENGTCPFLWRTLIRRELIERGRFRLDERVLLGEDTAFLCKVYPQARGIAVLPDRLYHYCTNREGSLMNGIGYREREQRVRGHVRLAASIAADWSERGSVTAAQAGRGFLEWMFGLLYEDLRAVSLKERDRLIRELAPVFLWYDAGRKGSRARTGRNGQGPDMAIRIRRKYSGVMGRRLAALREIDRQGTKERGKPERSVIIPAGGERKSLKQMIRSLCEEKDGENTEGILLDYGVTSDTDAYLETLLNTLPWVRRYPVSGGSLMECIREGAAAADGGQIRILVPKELLNPADPRQLLSEILEEAENARKRGEGRVSEALLDWMAGEGMRGYLTACCMKGGDEGRSIAALLIRLAAVLQDGNGGKRLGMGRNEEINSRPILRLAAECLKTLEESGK